MKKTFEYIAALCQRLYGVYYSEPEEYFICPECGEPLYKSDYEEDTDWTECPVCGAELTE